MSWISDLADRLLIERQDLAEARKLAAAADLGGESGADAYLRLCRLVGKAADPDEAILGLPAPSAGSGGDAATLVGALIVHGYAALRAEYGAQPDAVAARGEVAARAEAAYPAIGAAFGFEVLDFVTRLAGTVAVELSRIAASRAPLVRVETGLSLPSSLLAWDLYGDPLRGAELAERNRCGTAMVMPVVFEALAS